MLNSYAGLTIPLIASATATFIVLGAAALTEMGAAAPSASAQAASAGNNLAEVMRPPGQMQTQRLDALADSMNSIKLPWMVKKYKQPAPACCVMPARRPSSGLKLSECS